MGRKVVVKQGQDAFSIAANNKLQSWTRLWNDSANADLKSKRKSPGNLHPGDALVIPDPEPKFDDGATGARHRFTSEEDTPVLRLVVKNPDGSPISERPYALHIDNELVADAYTASNGLIEHEIPATAKAGTLRVYPDETKPAFYYHWKLKLGWLNDESTLRGVQGRLRNLGYPAGPVDGVSGKKTRRGIRLFKQDQGLEPVDEELDETTRGQLVAMHDEA